MQYRPDMRGAGAIEHPIINLSNHGGESGVYMSEHPPPEPQDPKPPIDKPDPTEPVKV